MIKLSSKKSSAKKSPEKKKDEKKKDEKKSPEKKKDEKKKDEKDQNCVGKDQTGVHQSDAGHNEALLNTFWTPHKTIHLEANGSGQIELQFLPFNVGMRQCSVLLLSDMVI